MLNMYEICFNTPKKSDFQYVAFQILAVHLHFGLFWSTGIPNVYSQLNVCTDQTISLKMVHIGYTT